MQARNAMRKILIGSAVLLIIATAAYLRYHHGKTPIEIGYAGNREVTLWSTTAQVREPVATVNYGERLDVLQRFQDQVQVRTTSGTTGWIPERDLLSADLWQTSKDLEKKGATMPVEALGHTKVLSNLHIAPGRESLRIRQLNKDVPLEVLERQPVPVTSVQATGAGEDSNAAPGKKEDWWLVRAHIADQTTITGWIVGRFIDLDVPAPLPDYASSAGMRIVAWLELNRVADGAKTSKPQYLLVGTHGPEGQPCDFSLLRVYTWGQKKERYETAFVESDVCGKLPIKLQKATTPGGEVKFEFENLTGKGSEPRIYVMRQTVVRRVREGNEPKPHKHKH
ncbi:MAG: SH3 domain-containing protein [Candidatus Acidiferrales bacterium]